MDAKIKKKCEKEGLFSIKKQSPLYIFKKL